MILSLSKFRETRYQKQNKNKRLGDMAQVMECLPRKHEALGSISNTGKRKKSSRQS
jgi:hypothetical protein